MHNSDVAGAEALARAIGNRTHRLPHRGVLIRDAGDAGVVAVLHCSAILQEVIRTSANAAEIAVEIDADFRRAKRSPRILVDPDALAPGDEVEHRVGVVQRNVEDG